MPCLLPQIIRVMTTWRSSTLPNSSSIRATPRAASYVTAKKLSSADEEVDSRKEYDSGKMDNTARFRIRLGCFVLGLITSQIPPGQEIRSQSGPSVPKEVTVWLQSAAIPLDSTSPHSGQKDLLPLLSVIGDARIVAMGEATHGTREFFQLKHRMLAFLVEKMGFTVFGIEANWPESLAVNDYVLNGKGDPAQVLAGLYFWTWNTEEVLDMIQWM